MEVEIKLKRTYEEPSPEDGFRILVDRLWPRGISKEKAKIDLWFREIAPSDGLRKYFGHDPAKWEDFKKKYIEEIKKNREAFEKLKKIIIEHKKVTLVYSASDTQHNNAVVLKELLKSELDK